MGSYRLVSCCFAVFFFFSFFFFSGVASGVICIYTYIYTGMCHTFICIYIYIYIHIHMCSCSYYMYVRAKFDKVCWGLEPEAHQQES